VGKHVIDLTCWAAKSYSWRISEWHVKQHPQHPAGTPTALVGAPRLDFPLKNSQDFF